MIGGICLLGAAGCYLAGAVCYASHLLLRRPAVSAAARATTVAAVCLHTIAIGIHCAQTRSIPFTTPAGTLSATAWAIALAYLILQIGIRPRPDALGAVALPAAFLCLFTGTVLHRSGPASADSGLLDTRLISLHVAALLFAYSLLILACGCAALYLVQYRLLKRKRPGAWFGRLPALAGIDHLCFVLVAFAFPLLNIGLVCGAIAAVADGPYKQWLADQKVLASLVTWAVYGLYLGLYLGLRQRGPRTNSLLLMGLPAALLTYFLPSQMHQFG